MKKKLSKKELAALQQMREQQMKVKAGIARLAKIFPNGILSKAPSEEEVRKQRKELLKEVAFLKPYAELGAKFYKTPEDQKSNINKRKPDVDKISRAKTIIERHAPGKKALSSCRSLATFLNNHSIIGDKFTKDWVNTHLKSLIKK